MVEKLIHASEHLVGFAIVIVTLAVLWGFTVLIGKIFGGQTAPVTQSASPEPVAATQSAPSDIEEDDVVVVSAAVAALLSERHRIVSIRPQASRWGSQGRADHHASHRIR